MEERPCRMDRLPHVFLPMSLVPPFLLMSQTIFRIPVVVTVDGGVIGLIAGYAWLWIGGVRWGFF